MNGNGFSKLLDIEDIQNSFTLVRKIMKYYERKDCRLCGCVKFYKALELTPTPCADDYVSSENLNKKHDISNYIAIACTALLKFSLISYKNK